MQTTETVKLQLPKWPAVTRTAYREPNIANNLMAVSDLCNADYAVYFHHQV